MVDLANRASAFPAQAPTSEEAWATLVAHAPELAISTRPVVVVAPHPDDEALAVGGLIAELRDRDVPVHVLVVTDGEASHPGRPGLAETRIAEQLAALDELGVEGPAQRLGLPDGRVAARGEELLDALGRLVGPDTVVLAPWEHDGHTDHDACGGVARMVAESVGARLLAYPVWAWQWASPEDLGSVGLRRVSLGRAARERKARAIACYPSQTVGDADGPATVPPEALVRFSRPWDVVFDVR